MYPLYWLQQAGRRWAITTTINKSPRGRYPCRVRATKHVLTPVYTILYTYICIGAALAAASPVPSRYTMYIDLECMRLIDCHSGFAWPAPLPARERERMCVCVGKWG